MKASSALHLALAAIYSGLGHSLPLEDGNSDGKDEGVKALVVRGRALVSGDAGATSNHTLAARETCIIRGWSGGNCDGTNYFAYEYQRIRGECRSCRAFNSCHSFSIEGACGLGNLIAFEGDCDTGSQSGNVDFAYSGCYNVNTGMNWAGGRPCFW